MAIEEFVTGLLVGIATDDKPPILSGLDIQIVVAWLCIQQGSAESVACEGREIELPRIGLGRQQARSGQKNGQTAHGPEPVRAKGYGNSDPIIGGRGEIFSD